MHQIQRFRNKKHSETHGKKDNDAATYIHGYSLAFNLNLVVNVERKVKEVRVFLHASDGEARALQRVALDILQEFATSHNIAICRDWLVFLLVLFHVFHVIQIVNTHLSHYIFLFSLRDFLQNLLSMEQIIMQKCIIDVKYE